VDTLFEVQDLHDAKVLPETNQFGDPTTDFSLQSNLPEVQGVMRDLRKVINSAPGQRVLIGEIYSKTPADLARWYGHDDELQMPMDTQLGFINKMDAAAFRKKITEGETMLNGNMPLFVFDNHDNMRSWDRYGDGQHNLEIAKVLATVLLTTRDEALMYYGQELGMTTLTPVRKQDVKDPIGVIGWPKEKGRDGERTPMQWDVEQHAGFTTGKPWLPIPPSAIYKNVTTEQQDPDSLLNWYKLMMKLRRSNPAFTNGSNIMLDHDKQDALVWLRKPQNPSPEHPAVVVACNFSAQPVTLSLKADMQKNQVRGQFLRSVARTDHGMGPMNLDAVALPPFGVFIGEVRY
jgi:alpha-glucosidase